MATYIPDENGELTALDQTTSVMTEATAHMPTGELGAAFFKMLLSLVVLVVLLFASYWFIKRLIQQKLQRGTGDAKIHVIEKKMISPKTMLYLVEVNQKKILLAESHLEIKRLESFEESRSAGYKDL